VKESLTCFPRFQPVPEWYIEARVDDGVQMPARVWRQALAGLGEATPPTEAGTIRTPTLIIRGNVMSCCRGLTVKLSLPQSQARGWSSIPTPVTSCCGSSRRG
jgi:hypothetical protein